MAQFRTAVGHRVCTRPDDRGPYRLAGATTREHLGGPSTAWPLIFTRLLSTSKSIVPFYDPVSYYQGSVWPLFTGWVALAEYRASRVLSAYQHLLQNADWTWFQDPGAVTELLSGAFFRSLGRSTPHQIWSSAMVFTPALRGLFGLDWDALRHTLRVAPNLPATWDHARLRNVTCRSEACGWTSSSRDSSVTSWFKPGPSVQPRSVSFREAHHRRGVSSGAGVRAAN